MTSDDDFAAALADLKAAKERALLALAGMRAARDDLRGKIRDLTVRIDEASIAIGAPGRRRKVAGDDTDPADDGTEEDADALAATASAHLGLDTAEAS